MQSKAELPSTTLIHIYIYRVSRASSRSRCSVHQFNRRIGVKVSDPIYSGVALSDSKNIGARNLKRLGEHDADYTAVGNQRHTLIGMAATHEFCGLNHPRPHVGEALAIGKLRFRGPFHPVAVDLRVSLCNFVVRQSFEIAEVNLSHPFKNFDFTGMVAPQDRGALHGPFQRTRVNRCKWFTAKLVRDPLQLTAPFRGQADVETTVATPLRGDLRLAVPDDPDVCLDNGRRSGSSGTASRRPIATPRTRRSRCLLRVYRQ